jgi:four helix bundle protein
LDSKFRTYESAIQFAQSCRKLNIAKDLKEQLNRSSASIALNLAEGSAADTVKERYRFYVISLRSFRESEAILRIADISNPDLIKNTNLLGGQLDKLCKATTTCT